MKKYLPILACCFISSFAYCQEKPVQWEGSSQKLDDSTYVITVNASLQPNWYLYAEDNVKDGIEAIKLAIDNEKILTKGSLQYLRTPEIIHDEVFNSKEKVLKGGASFRQVLVSKNMPSLIRLVITAYCANGSAFTPVNETIDVKMDGTTTESRTIKLSSVNLQHPVSECGDKQNQNNSVLTIFLLGLGGGLIALFTPCVFPMIPVTVSFFTNKSKTKKQGAVTGILYGIFIFLIYVLASLPFHLINNLNPQILNSISTNAWLNVFFFIVFLIFACSFFGWFEISIPSFIATKTDAKSSIENISGIFFLALTLTIVSFSCTGPILGSLLVSSVSNKIGAWDLTAGMAGFGIALALPFAFFAMFPHWLKTIPKSGGWLDTVKKTLAFFELALAFKFLSNADLVEHWGILKRETFIGIWIIIAFALACYLLGLFDKKKYVVTGLQNADRIRRQKQKLSSLRIALGTLTLLFAFYLTPGITQTKYANLKLLSGFPPPLSYSVYGKDNVNGKGLEPNVVNDYDKALQLAKMQHKPLLIDFTGWACVNCRKMEEQVWTNDWVTQLIKERFILVSLYVDDRKKLSADDRFIYTSSIGVQKDINTVGDKYATFQSENFGQVTQPLYVILNPEQKLLNNPVGYTPDVNKYVEWLTCGLNAFKK